MFDTGASRRIARYANNQLVGGGDQNAPQNILIPGQRDNEKHFNLFYGIPVRLHSGVYFGFLEPFCMNDFIYTELAISRDGLNWNRFPERKKLIEYGADGTWDDETIFASPSWVKVGEEWWIYYSGWDGPHGTPIRAGTIGLAKIRKEGFASWRGPQGGGIIATRQFTSPGGDLNLNAIVGDGEIKVRVSDANRKPIAGFDYDDCDDLSGHATRMSVTWNGKSLDRMREKVLQPEIFLRNAELFTLAATTTRCVRPGERPQRYGRSFHPRCLL